MVVGGTFLVAGGNPSALLEPVDQPFDAVALAVGGAVEARGAALVALAGDHHPNAASAQRLAHWRAAVALVAHQAPRTQPRASATSAFERAPVDQCRERHLVVPLPRGQDEDDRLALALGPDVDFGAEPTARAAERFGRGIPPFAPAAC